MSSIDVSKGSALLWDDDDVGFENGLRGTGVGEPISAAGLAIALCIGMKSTKGVDAQMSRCGLKYEDMVEDMWNIMGSQKKEFHTEVQTRFASTRVAHASVGSMSKQTINYCGHEYLALHRNDSPSDDIAPNYM